MISFLVQKHLVRSVQVVEVWRDGIFVAAIYGHGDGLRVVSKYLGTVSQEGRVLDIELAKEVRHTT